PPELLDRLRDAIDELLFAETDGERHEGDLKPIEFALWQVAGAVAYDTNLCHNSPRSVLALHLSPYRLRTSLGDEDKENVGESAERRGEQSACDEARAACPRGCGPRRGHHQSHGEGRVDAATHVHTPDR